MKLHQKKLRIKQRTEPWMTSEILQKIAARDGLLYLMRENDDGNLKENFKKLRNEIQREVKIAKSSFMEQELEQNINKPKKLWQNLQSLGYSNKTKSRTNIVLRISDKLCYDTLEICNHINDFFTNIASNLVKKLPTASGIYSTNSKKFKDFYSNKGITPGSYKLNEVSQDFIQSELKSLNPKKSTGLDGIGPRFLRDGANQLTPVTTYIINLSFEVLCER